MFSVIIPLYNKAEYVEKAIDSVFSQTYQEFELIVVNDGSKDNGLQIVQDLNEKKYNNKITIVSQKNSGVSTARNNGISLASRDYICFLDADDWWEPTFLEEMRVLINKYPQAGIYGCNYYIVKHNGKRIAPVGVNADFQDGIINYFQVYAKTICMPLWTGAVVIPAHILKEEFTFNPKLKLGEDFDLWVRIAFKYPVVFYNKPLSNYNQDVEIKNRAVGGKLYEPDEHMLFTNYGNMVENTDFKYLIDRLSIYSLYPYYLSGKNDEKVKEILSNIKWEEHDFKYRFQYRIMPKPFLRTWFTLLKKGAEMKRKLFS